MIRVEVPQITNAQLVPGWLKNLVDEFLDHIVHMVRANRPFLPLIKEAQKRGAKNVFLFAPEVGGSSIFLAQDIVKEFPELSVTLLDDKMSASRIEHFANLIHENLKELPRQSIYSPVPSDSLVISINHAHRLNDEEYKKHIKELQQKFDYILIGEGNNKSIRQVIGMTIIVPLVILLMSPLIKPLRLSRFIFTYLVPILPLILVWDGIAALFRIRSPELSKALNEATSMPLWQWHAGKLPNNRGGFIIYSLGFKN